MIVVLEGLKLLGGTLASVVACVCHKFIGLDKHNWTHSCRPYCGFA